MPALALSNAIRSVDDEDEGGEEEKGREPRKEQRQKRLRKETGLVELSVINTLNFCTTIPELTYHRSLLNVNDQNRFLI